MKHYVKFAESSGFAAIRDPLKENTSIEKIKLHLPEKFLEDPLVVEEENFEDEEKGLKYNMKTTLRKRDKIIVKIKRTFYD